MPVGVGRSGRTGALITIHRHAPKRDANELAIVEALRAVGCLVERISGAGVPDLLVWAPKRKRLLLVEVKQPKARKRLSDVQQAFRATWAAAQPAIVSTVQEALLLVGE